MEEQGGYIISGLLNGIKTAWQNVKTWISTALSDIKTAFSDAWSAIQDAAADIWNNGIVATIKDAVNGVIGVINRMISAVVNGINSLFSSLSFSIDLPGGKSIGLSLPQFAAPQIPYLAQGAVIPPNAPFAAVLGDQTHGTNIEAPLDTIKQAVAEVTGGDEQLRLLREQNRLLQDILAKTGIRIDGDKFADAVTYAQDRRARARGY